MRCSAWLSPRAPPAIRDQVAIYKLPERLEILDQLPFMPTGKIQRFLLQRLIEARDKAAK
jgi:acyl-CoA synthetase (AMP-forming)/AMP-acid ligase II